jgi:hypothetical protein
MLTTGHQIKLANADNVSALRTFIPKDATNLVVIVIWLLGSGELVGRASTCVGGGTTVLIRQHTP